MTKLPAYIAKAIEYAKIFGKDLKAPETESEIKMWFSRLACDLSPENLTCDGELSRSAVAAKRKQIETAWAYLERKLGRKVSESETYNW